MDKNGMVQVVKALTEVLETVIHCYDRREVVTDEEVNRLRRIAELARELVERQ